MKLAAHIHTKERGFSIVEILVSIAIILIITTVLLARYSKFDSETILTNLAYDVSLSVREAQVFGLGIRETTTGAFDVSYGIHFEQNNKNYFLFADLYTASNPVGTEGIYDDGIDVIVTTHSLGQKYNISRICITQACTAASAVDIVFRRPDPDALIRADGNSTLESDVTIEIQSGQGTTRNIYVANTGQISVTESAAGL